MLLVGCPAALVSACCEAGPRLSVTVLAVQECAPGALHAAQGRLPFAILVPEEIYRADPGAFDGLARQGSSALLRLDARDTSHGDAQRHLAEAVLGAAAELLAEAGADDAG